MRGSRSAAKVARIDGSRGTAMLKLVNVTRRFGDKRACADISLEIPDGQMVGIIGRSGAGKSTLLRMINRLIDPSDGTIEWDGVAVSAAQGSARCATGSATAP